MNAATGTASWDPISFLVSLTGVNEPQELMEWLFEGGASGGESDSSSLGVGVSTLLHEITHLWSARSTRLGAHFAIEAARPLTAPPPRQLSKRDAHRLGILAPVLEGLAMFAEMDAPGACPLGVTAAHIYNSSPLTHFIDWFRFGRSLARDRAFRLARASELVRDGHALELLLFSNRPAHWPYFAGYLYIKALYVQARTALPELDAATFLTLAVRLVADSPAIDGPAVRQSTPLSATALLNAMHEGILSVLDRAKLQSLFKAIAANEVVRNNLHALDIYALLNGSITLSTFPPAARSDLPSSLCAAANLFMLARCTGVLASSKYDGTLDLRLQFEGRHDAIVLPTFLAGSDSSSWQAFVGGRCAKLHDALLRRVGATVTAAAFMDMTTGGLGVAAWDDGALLGFTPITPQPERASMSDWLNELEAGVTISPIRRLRVENDTEVGPELATARKEAADTLIRFVAAGSAVASLEAERFAGALPAAEY